MLSSHSTASSLSSTDQQVRVLNPLSQLSPVRTFTNYDLGLTTEERDGLMALNITYASHYENYGDLSVLLDELPSFIASLGAGNSISSVTIANAINRIIKDILAYTSHQTAWVTIRAFPPITTFREPRWHADRYDFPPTGQQYKAAVTLKGDGTVFYNAPLEERMQLESVKTDRKLLAHTLNPELFISADFGQGTLFTTGSNSAPFHTEPDITKERLFMAVVPGSREQIRKVYEQTPEQEIMPVLSNNGFYCYFVGPRLLPKFTISPYENTEIIVFRLPQDHKPQQLETISEIIKYHHPTIVTEVANGERDLVKATFTYGAIITINDISKFFANKGYVFDSDESIYAALQDYVQHSQQHPDSTYIDSPPITFNPIRGSNTSGLFMPPARVNLDQDESFMHFDLGLTHKERDSLQNLNVNSVSHYENYGDLAALPTEINTFINAVGSGNTEYAAPIAHLVGKLVAKILTMTGQENAWVTMRAFTPTAMFREPRWHSDTYYYPTSVTQYKIAITLKGDPTIFYDASAEERGQLEKLKSNKDALKNALNPDQIVSPRFGEGSLFIVGPDYAPIHSEPNIRSERLFLSMIPGSKQQIETLYQSTPERTIISLLTPKDFYCYFVGPKFQGSYIASPYENTEIIVFKLNIDLTQHDQTQNITDIITRHDDKITIRAEQDDTNELKVCFPYGAVITLTNLSGFFANRQLKDHSDAEIFKGLKDYSETVMTSATSITTTAKPAQRFAFNAISGRNTSGLFRPQAQVAIQDGMSVVINPANRQARNS
jgi:hypothetical protein